ncbi:MAG TPA: NUDIX hydrolase [Bradyrhizobium sp.]|uniref:NUDIX hydrolase n=1 Tax=Bradyrhizobium sp. TaxID=376 RepID=UPI002D80BFCD|nr:NUDIX hydrolase [Bradyrhizobium sp.]HET7889737.1 NUDIX hydrolase [Bradyrhizobium sp.]
MNCQNNPSEDTKADQSACLKVVGPHLLARGFRDYERYSVRFSRHGSSPVHFERDVLRCGPVVGVLALDLERDEVVLTRQFRLGAFLVNRENDTLEIVAGRIDPGEDAATAARRECFEEIGVEARQLRPVMQLAPAPAWSDETMTLFVAVVDAHNLPARAGASHEHEEIAVVRYKVDAAIGLVGQKLVQSAPTIVALQWLKLNRDSIPTLLETAA